MTDKTLQNQIRHDLEVVESFDASQVCQQRIDFLADYLIQTGAKGYVLGISGGIDSTVAGRLAQLACEQVREKISKDVKFVALRLPYQNQKDEADAQAALQFIAADQVGTINIGQITDLLSEQVLASETVSENQLTHYHRGNIKARMRMVAQFTVAGCLGMLVIGTDQAAEALTGFYTKFGDGAADLTPLTGLTKSMVRQLGSFLGCPESLVNKVPTADLESDMPLLADEKALGVSYENIDTYLMGGDIPSEGEETILRHYFRSAHKRAMPVTPAGWANRQG